MFKKCGFLTITGFPNSGKSTFINNIINKKISIISSKVQTTKDEIKGILNFKNNHHLLNYHSRDLNLYGCYLKIMHFSFKIMALFYF